MVQVKREGDKSIDWQADDESIDGALLFEQFMRADRRGMLLVDTERDVTAMNGAAREMLGYRGALPQPAERVVSDVHFGFAVGDALHDRRPVTVESYAPNPDRLLRFTVMPILDASGVPVMLVATLEDVTNVRHLETVRRDFVANVSHELRTPLASIQLLVETLQRGALTDPEAGPHFVHRIEVEAHAMARLVEELLELSRLETGVLSLAVERVDLRRLFDDVVNRLKPTADEKLVNVRLEVPDGMPAVSADPKRLEQVLMNLVHNAVKFTPGGGQVTVQARRHGPAAEIAVSDTGVGMESAESARIFERFYKVDKGRNRSTGAGLGLAIARHLLELHGSRLEVVSEVGRGSRFFFSLPIVEEGDR